MWRTPVKTVVMTASGHSWGQYPGTTLLRCVQLIVASCHGVGPVVYGPQASYRGVMGSSPSSTLGESLA